jgi:hypothetical protein
MTTTFPGSPRTVRGGIVLIDPDSGAVRRVIVLQYNPDTLTRSLQVQGAGGEAGDRLDALRLKGPPAETIKLDAEIDAVDQLEFPERNFIATQLGILPQLAALETIVYPASATVQANRDLADAGTLEIAPAEAPLAVFVWSRNRVLPVRLTEFSITEEAFDTGLNPIRAKVSLGLRVLNANDLGFDHKGSMLFMAYHRQQERFAGQGSGTGLGPLGIARVL